MAYGDKWDFHPDPRVSYQRYTDGTILPHFEIAVTLNGEPYGYIEIHAHRTKYAPHASVGVTSRVGPSTQGDVMPYKSVKQRKFLHAKHPKLAARWDKTYGAKIGGGKTKAQKRKKR